MEWHENFDGYHKTKYGFLSHPKAKLSEFGDQQTSKISVYIQNVLLDLLRKIMYLINQMCSGNQLGGVGIPAAMFWEPRLPEIFIGATNFETWAP